ncbi:MAG: hypothetical protein AAB932_03520, partial [Patescibacteria group bacterium]
ILQEKEVYNAHGGKSVALQDFYYWNVKTTSTGLFHKKDMGLGFAWDESLGYIEDWELLLQFGARYPEGFLHVSDPLFTYIQKYGTDGMCSRATYGDWANAFEHIYNKHKDDPFMKGQSWYPERVEKYRALQAQYERGEILSAVYKYFPDYQTA